MFALQVFKVAGAFVEYLFLFHEAHTQDHHLEFELQIPLGQAFTVLNHSKFVAVQASSGSHSEPSLLHFIKGFAITIQFQPGKSGATPGGIEYHQTEAGAQKQSAVQTHQVSVGVINHLKKSVGDQVQSRPQAEGTAHQGPSGDIG